MWKLDFPIFIMTLRAALEQVNPRHRLMVTRVLEDDGELCVDRTSICGLECVEHAAHEVREACPLQEAIKGNNQIVPCFPLWRSDQISKVILLKDLCYPP